MPIRFACPSCAKPIVVKDEFAGRTGKCPGCQTPVTVPAAAAPPPPPAFEVIEDTRAAPEPPPPDPDLYEAAVAPAPAPAEPEPRPRRRPPRDRDDAADDDRPRRKRPATAEADPETEAVLARAGWCVKEGGGKFFSNDVAGLFETYQDKEPYAIVRDATFKLFGFIALDVPLLRPRPKAEIRLRDNTGPVVLTVERFVPLFDIPFMPPKPKRWEVRGPAGDVIGSVAFSRKGYSLLKLAKGQFFQDEIMLLDAAGTRVGEYVIERGAMGAPKAVYLADLEGGEHGSFGSRAGEKVSQMMEDAREGKAKVEVSYGLGDAADADWKGMSGNVSPARAGDRFSHALTLAVVVMHEVFGFEMFKFARSPQKR